MGHEAAAPSAGAATAYDDRFRAHLARLVERHQLTVPKIVLPTARHVLAGPTRLHLLDWGAPGNPLVVLLHGAGLNAHTWDAVALGLSQRFRCLAVDLRGHGESEWSAALAYNVALHTDDVLGLLDDAGARRCTIVGHSLGGIVGMSVALTAPALVRALVLVDVGPAPRDDSVDRVDGNMQGDDTFASVEAAVDAILEAKPHLDRTLLAWTLEQNLMRLHDGTYTWKYDRRHRMTRDHVDEILAENRALAARVADIRCPVLLAYGAESDMLSRAAIADFVASAPHARAAEVPGARHAVQSDNPGELVRLVRELLADES